MALTLLFKELWAIFDFLKFKNQIYYRKFGGPIKNILEKGPLTLGLSLPLI